MAKTSTELSTRLTQAQVTKEASPTRRVIDMIEANKAEIARALPAHVPSDRFVKTVATSIRENPKLLECSAESLVAAVMTCAQLGLEPGPLGHVYLIPYSNKKELPNGETKWVSEVEVQLGYKGLLDLAYRGGEVEYIAANPVYENEEVTIDRASGEVTHPYSFDMDPGKLVGFYAVARTKTGQQWVEPMRLAEVERIRNSSKNGKSPAWAHYFDEMGRKVVLKRLCKKLPISIETAKAISVDDKQNEIDVNFTPQIRQLHQAIEDHIEAAAAPVDPQIEARREELKKQAEALSEQG